MRTKTEQRLYTLLSYLDRAAARQHGITFVEARGEEEYLPYRDLRKEACSLLASLQSAGVAPGDEVVFQLGTNRDFLISFWACLLGGLIPVPLAVGTNDEHRRKVFLVWTTLNWPFLLCESAKTFGLLERHAETQGHADLIGPMSDRRLLLDDRAEWSPDGVPDPLLYDASPDDIALIQFSSGSTGRPKGVTVTHHAAVVNTTDMVNRLKVTDEDRYLSWMPLTHDFGIIGMHLTPLVAGIDQVQIPTALFIRNPMLWLHATNEHRATMIASPNFGYRHFLKFFRPDAASDWDLSCVRLIQNGAEPISPTLCHEFLDTLEPFGLSPTSMLPGYGLAEATLAVSYSLFDEVVPTVRLDRSRLGLGDTIDVVTDDHVDAVDFVDVGFPVDHMEVRITDGMGAVLPDGTIGVIEIRGESVTQGYYNNPEATARAIRGEGWLDTGDLGCMRDGRILITGRAKDIIFVGGVNYYPHDVERVATELDELDVNKVVVCGVRNDATEQEEIACFIYYKRGLEEFADLADKVRDHIMRNVGILFEYVLPVTSIPKTTSGKVQRYALAERLRSGEFAGLITELEAIREGREAEGKRRTGAALFEKTRDEIRHELRELGSAIAGMPVDNDDTPFADYGFDSVRAVEYRNRLQKRFSLELPISLVFDYSTVNALTEFLLDTMMKGSAKQGNEKEHSDREKGTGEIAVVGIGCRFPGGVDSYNDLVELLGAGGDTIGAAPAWRWGRTESPWNGGFVDDVECFDNQLFAITPNEATALDPQQRLLLETAWHALEHGNQTPDSLDPTRTGVMIGISANEYGRRWEGDTSDASQYSLTGTMLSTAAGRISYALGLNGPTIAVDTACSSSLVAVHLAMRSLREGESDCMIAGGVNLILDDDNFQALSRLGALSPDGRCKTFGNAANGYGRGEGCGLVVLKRLADAERDGDTIYGVISGSAVNHDGRSNGLTAPSGIAQERVIGDALRDAGIGSETVGYVEAHGTGTALGDPQEINALQNVYSGPMRTEPLLIGSVKSNVGHLESAAGIAGLIKAVASVREGRIFRSLHCDQPSDYVSWNEIEVRVADREREWQSVGGRVAGVSAFGLSGTNAHLILREYVQEPVGSADTAASTERSRHTLLPISAEHPDALVSMAARYRERILLNDTLPCDLGATAALYRRHLRHRIAAVGANPQELFSDLNARLKEREETGAPVGDGRIAWLFTGQGSQYRGMGGRLYEAEPIFRETVDICSALFSRWLDYSVADVVYGTGDEDIDETLYTQPAIFTVEYALAQLYLSFGLRPDAVAGHSIGEYVAACIAGVMSLDDAVRLVAHRALFMQELEEPGGMVAAFCSERDALVLANGDPVNVAAVNGPESVVIAGDTTSLERLVSKFGEQGIRTRKLRVSHAFHSPLMEPAAARFRDVAAGVEYRTPAVPIVSCVSGAFVPEGAELDATYWTDQILATVRFADAIRALADAGFGTFLEVGSTPTLSNLGDSIDGLNGARWISSMRKDADDRSLFLAALASLYEGGADIDWSRLYPDGSYSRVSLPLYPFLRNRFWLPKRVSQHTDDRPASPADTSHSTIHHDINHDMTPHVPSHSFRESVFGFLLESVSEKTGLATADIPADRDLFEIGLDSLVLIALRQTIIRSYGVEVPQSLLYNRATINAIADYICEHSDRHAPATVAADGTSTAILPERNGAAMINGEHRSSGTANGSGGRSSKRDIVEEVVNRQLDLMAEQLRLLRDLEGGEVPGGGTGDHNGNRGTVPNRTSNGGPVSERHVSGSGDSANGHSGNNDSGRKPFVPYRPIKTTEEGDASRSRFLEGLIERYNGLTGTSKQRTDFFRTFLANNRNIAGFRPKWKELIYQLQVERSDGSRVYDVDGNEYLDLTMGFGVYLFGHNPAFIREAVEAELRKGASVGPMTPLADEAARLLSELTGIERAAFYNSGTEAIMVALRLARTATGRSNVVIFSGSYHGSFDGILALPGDDHRSVPLAPGVPQSMVDDIVVLPYDSEEALDYIRGHAHELAAVLVETVQSRRPDVQPKEFLQEVRRITEASGTALIFDEVITGFRIHPGGAQHHFGIRADIVTYGKVIGGGMPLGIVAGKRRFLDGVDGGEWTYGDDSTPTKQNTFVAGTFCHHPLAMSATIAVLKRMAADGEQICSDLNLRTERFADGLNAFFRKVGVPMRIVHFGSLFRFELSGEMELLYFLLMLKGVYVWEGRNCFFSTEHSDSDIRAIRDAVVESVIELIEGGFVPGVELPGDIDSIREKLDSGELQSSDRLSMTSVQRRIFALSQEAEGELAYHLSAGVILDGAIDVDRIERAFAEVVARHEGLRTGFLVEDDELCQQVHRAVEFRLERGIIESGDPDEAFRRMVRPFDLATPPLLRVGLFDLPEERRLLVLDIHHIVADGLSISVIFEEFAQLYNGEKLQPVRTQYRDVLTWEKEFEGSEEFVREETFWRAILARPAEALALPTDREAGPVGSFSGGAVYLDHPADAVRRIARDNGCSVYMVLLAAFNGLLHRLTGTGDFRIGIVHAGRSDDRFASTVGMFANSLLFPCSIDGDVPFADHLMETRVTALAVYENFAFPFERLAELDRNAVRDQRVGFSYERAFDRQLRVGDASGVEYSPDRWTSISDLALDAVEDRDGLRFRFDYNSDLFDRETVERIAGYFVRFLEGIERDITRPLGDYPLMSGEELAVVLGNCAGGPELSGLPNAVTLVEGWVARTPDAPALLFEGGSMSYRDLDRIANGIANMLVEEHGVGPNRVVAILAERSTAFIAGILGALKAGGAFLPVDPGLPDARIEYMLDDADVAVVLTTPATAERTCLAGRNAIGMEAIGRSENGPDVDIAPDSVAYMIYTSGSTGKPKGVMVSHGNLSNYACWTSDVRINRNGVEVVSLHTTPSFDMIIGQIVPPLVTGKALFLHEPSLGIDRIMERVFSPDTPIDCAVLTPSHALLLEDTDLMRSNVKVASIGGEALKEQHTRILWGLNPDMQILNDYGPTEATVTCIVHRVNDDGRVNVVGTPVMNTSIYILDGRLKPCPVGVIGEICVGGASVALGYRNRPELNAERFIPNPFVDGDRLYRTGDLGRLLPDGTVEFFGRRDRQVKLFGNRIELDEIESVLAELPNVKGAAVKLVAAQERQILVGYVATDLPVDTETLLAELSRRLPYYMVPGLLMRVDRLPLTPNGKIDFAKLPDADVSTVGTGNETLHPRNRAEQDVLDAWTAVLGSRDELPGVGVRHNFFEVGGDSIKAIRIASRLRKLGYDVEGGSVMRGATVEGIAAGLNERAAQRRNEPVSGDALLSPIQRWFFERPMPNRNHWNQELVLRRSEPIDPERMRNAFAAVTAHHDAFRLRFSEEGDSATARFAGPGEANGFVLEVVEAGAESEERFAERLRDGLDRAHRSLDIAAGPLAAAVLVRSPEMTALGIAIHHLVVDAVSWGIIVDDLLSAYDANAVGTSVEFDPKTDSVAAYSQALLGFSQSDELLRQLPYWSAVEKLASGSAPLPVDAVPSADTEAQTVTCSTALDESVTAELTGGANRPFATTAQELVTGAFLLALREWTGGDSHAIRFEGHGRESIPAGNGERASVDRTVGWFTTTYPLVLESSGSVESLVINTKERLRSVPMNGIGYGLLRYMTPEALRPGLVFEQPTDILFNYLGALDFDDAEERGGFAVEIDPIGTPADPATPRSERIAVDAYVRGGRLHWTIFFNGEEFDRETIDGFCGMLERACRKVVDTCATASPRLTPSDLEYSGFTGMAGLDDFLRARTLNAEEIETVRPLTPMQEGMLFNVLREGDTTSGLVQLGLTLRGSLDLGLVERAFRNVLQRHDALRSGFDWTNAPDPVSIVFKTPSVAFRSLTEPVERSRFLEADWNEGADLEARSQMRMTVMREDADLHTIAWTAHHIVMDGWCIGLVFDSFLAAYDALREGNEPSSQPAPSYGRYTGWLESYDREGSLAFWKEELADYDTAASIVGGMTRGSGAAAKPTEHGGGGSQKDFTLHFDEAEISAISDLAARLQTTGNVVVRTAWSVVLSHYSGRNDLVYGGVVSGRPADIEDVESIVGLFINTIPVRYRLESGASFGTHAHAAHENALRAEPHHYTPLPDVHRITSLGSRLFDHILVFENYPLDQELARGLKNRDDFSIENVAFRGSESFDLVLTVMLEHEQEVLFTYNDAIYDEGLIAHVSEMFRNVLRVAGENPEATISDIVERTGNRPAETTSKKRSGRKSLGSLKDTRARKVALDG